MQKEDAQESKIIFVLGTVAELIKIFPVIRQLQNLNAPWLLFCTGQSRDNFKAQYQDFQLPQEKLLMAPQKEAELVSPAAAFWWFMTSAFKSQKRITKETGLILNRLDKIVVHGDTLSTLLGSIYAKKWKLKLYHVEAGMRSGSLFSPFPEEITRKIVSALADVHFAQDERALLNLKLKKNRIHTHGNTAIEAHGLVLPKTEDKIKAPYVLVNLHRFENIKSPVRFHFIMEMMLEAGQIYPVIFIAHPHVEHKIKNEPGLLDRLSNNGVKLVPRVLFSEFIHLLNHCECLITDGHGNQEECYWLGIPCLVLRDKTEIDSGIGTNAMKCNFDRESFLFFLKNYQNLKVPPRTLQLSPSQIIAKNLTHRSF